MSLKPEVYCNECWRRLHPNGAEEKTCTHGCHIATCVECGKTRTYDEKPYWHCVGYIEDGTPNA